LLAQFNNLLEKEEGNTYLPDANSTYRLTFGHLKGYWPNNGEWQEAETHFEGILEKANTNEDYRLPTSIRVAYMDAVAHHTTVPVNFLYDLDTTRGNSGSPVLNAKGEFAGINFDRAITATINDFAWNENYSRSIGCSVDYIKWVLGQVGQADGLLQELK
jgi:hypothetical protein